MARKNRQLAEKADRARRERRAYAESQAHKVDKVAPPSDSIVATHFIPDPLTREDEAALVNEFLKHRRITRCPSGMPRPSDKYRRKAVQVREAYDAQRRAAR